MSAQDSKALPDLSTSNIGKVGKPHGFRGHFLVPNPTLDVVPEHLREVFLTDGTVFRVLEAESIHKGLKLLLEGISDEAGVKRLRGQDLWVRREAVKPMETGEYFVSDLIGCRVLDAADQELGILKEVETVGFGSPDRWWVHGPRGLFALPATDQTILKIDLAHRRIEVCNRGAFDDYATPAL